MAQLLSAVPVGLAQRGTFKLSSFKRKIRRKSLVQTTKRLKKSMNKIVQDTVNKKLSGIAKIPDNCDLCQKEFDKTDREQVFSWMLKVNEEREVYNLFCPECYSDYYTKEEEDAE